MRVRRISHFPAPIQVICEENYYFDCSVFCVEQDDNLGHFTCDPVTGDPVCLEGWAGDDCLTSKWGPQALQACYITHSSNLGHNDKTSGMLLTIMTGFWFSY